MTERTTKQRWLASSPLMVPETRPQMWLPAAVVVVDKLANHGKSVQSSEKVHYSTVLTTPWLQIEGWFSGDKEFLSSSVFFLVIERIYQMFILMNRVENKVMVIWVKDRSCNWTGLWSGAGFSLHLKFRGVPRKFGTWISETQKIGRNNYEISFENSAKSTEISYVQSSCV